jgi:hypothetical protein
MSISAMANAAAARRPDVGHRAAPAGAAEIAAAAATPPEQAPPEKQEASGVNTALNVLFGYIPTEVVTLYVAVAAALQPPTPAAGATAAVASSQAQWIAFWCFFVATPLVVWVVFASKLKAAGKPLPSTYDTWPVWEMCAALIAFFAWAFALPNTPFREFSNWYSPALASLAVLLASSVLGLLAPLFQNPLGTGTTPAVPATPDEPPAGGAG